MQDEFIEHIRHLSVSGDPLSTASAQTFVDAFAPFSHTRWGASDAPSTPQDSIGAVSKLKQARSTALLTLASRSSSATAPTIPRSKHGSAHAKGADENLAQLLTPVIRSRLADTTPHSLLSALNFLSALFSVLPSEAHHILTADGIIDLVLEAPDACNAVTSCSQLPSDEHLVSFAVAELISSAANSAATRKHLAAQQPILDWLDIACVSRRATTDLSLDSKRTSDAIAVVAGLADIKVYRATASDALQGLTQSASSQPTSHEDHVRKIQETRSERNRKDDSLYQIVHAELLATCSQRTTSNTSSLIQQATVAEYRRSIELSCLEVLAYLTVQPTFKERLAADAALLQILCTRFDSAAPNISDANKSIDIDSQTFDGALQLGLATILSNITKYPPSLTAEQNEVRRLRKFANAQNSEHDGDRQDQEEALETTPKVEKRCIAVLEAKGVETLSAIAVAGPPPSSNSAAQANVGGSGWKVNPSKAVRQACADALLALVTKQDRIMRGKAVQQGALKAVLALSAPVLHSLLPTKSNTTAANQHNSAGLFARSSASPAADVTADDLAPLQALAKLLISLNPSLLFPSHDGLLSVASVVCSLLLCPSSSRLQRFEALLALTNLASLSPELGARVAAFSFDSTHSTAAIKEPSTDDSITFSSNSVLVYACEQLLMEDHIMIRRAWIELLVNLLQVEQVFRYFVSTGSVPRTTSDSHAARTADAQDRLALRLRMLVGLSEVDEWAYVNHNGQNEPTEASNTSSDGGSGEPSLATRMACLAILAMVTESSNVVTALLTLERLFPVLLTNLVLDRSEDPERNKLERADLQPVTADPNQNSVGTEAQVQLNAINLSLRASYVLFNVLQHFRDSSSIDAEQTGGFEKQTVQSTLQESLSYHMEQLKKKAHPAHVDEARKSLLHVVAECLKLVRDFKDVSSPKSL